MTNILQFEDAIEQANSSRGTSQLRVLLGNGFSRACRNDLFAYDALFDSARDGLSTTAQRAFDALGTTDFEAVMRSLSRTATLLEVYSPDNPSLIDQIRKEASDLREALADVIAANHPERSYIIEEDRFRNCRNFLRNFGHIYTLNYDLLLYWALMNNDVDALPLRCDDGFRQPEDGPREYVEWDLSSNQQNIFYLHGALHIFDAGSGIQKYTWRNTGIPLVEQIRAALEIDYFPIYVAEGTSESKWTRVLHNSFLLRGFRSLATIGGILFIFGHSLNANDEHVLEYIERSKVREVYVSIFGDPDSQENQHIVQRAYRLITGRQQRNSFPLDVYFYDAQSARVWD